MFCVRCGAEIVNGNAFCEKCWVPVGSKYVIEKDTMRDTRYQWRMRCPRCGEEGLRTHWRNFL